MILNTNTRSILFISTGIIVIAFLLFYFVKYDANITGFFWYYGRNAVSPFLNPEKVFFAKEFGYDGCLYLNIALDINLNDPATVSTMDLPAYRYRRILLPALGRSLALANLAIIPYAIVAINGTSILGIIYIFTKYFRQNQQQHYKALLLFLIPGIWLTFGVSTVELLAGFFLLLSITSFIDQKQILVACAIGLACLAKETLLVAWCAFALLSLIQRNWEQIAWLIAAILPALLWNIHVIDLLYEPNQLGMNNFDYPFFGLGKSFIEFYDSRWSINLFANFYAVGLLLSAFGILLYRSKKTWDRYGIIFLIASLYGLIYMMSSTSILRHYFHFTRVYLDVFLLALLVAGKSHFERLFWIGCALESILFLYHMGN